MRILGAGVNGTHRDRRFFADTSVKSVAQRWKRSRTQIGERGLKKGRPLQKG